MSDLWLAGDSALTPEALHLSLDTFLDEQLRAKRALYQANGSSWVCKFYQKNQCLRGQECPYRHSRGDKTYVCKHWLRGLCKKGADTCDSLHVYDLSKMAYCQFMIDYGTCGAVDCMFNHTKPAEEKDCMWYARGFCKRGPQCKSRHRVREMCPDYLAGFCELGPQCEKGHPKWLLPEETEAPMPQYDANGNLIPGSDHATMSSVRRLVGMSAPRVVKTMEEMMCISCGQKGHMAGACPFKAQMERAGLRTQRDLSTVLCYRCGEMGHYASFCKNPKKDPPPGGWPGAKPQGEKRPFPGASGGFGMGGGMRM